MAFLEGWNEAVGLVLRAPVKTGFAANSIATASICGQTARNLEALTALLLSSQPQRSALRRVGVQSRPRRRAR